MTSGKAVAKITIERIINRKRIQLIDDANNIRYITNASYGFAPHLQVLLTFEKVRILLSLKNLTRKR